MPKLNFGEMDGANVRIVFGSNGRQYMSKSDLDEKKKEKCS